MITVIFSGVQVFLGNIVLDSDMPTTGYICALTYMMSDHDAHSSAKS